jgi:hypothetical protein
VTANAIWVRPAEDGDRRSLALLFAAVAEERDGIAAEPPIVVGEHAKRQLVQTTRVAPTRLRQLPTRFPLHDHAAIALYRKFRFAEEGRLTQHIRRANGELWDLIEMGLML